MKCGYRGKLLVVELDRRQSHIMDLPEKGVFRFIGGAGLNAWLLYQNLHASTKATDPENPLIFGAGPLVGTPFPTSARSTFTALSPLTGIFGDSNGGGVFGVQVKRAGYDHLVIRGASDKPCYLFITTNGVCEILDASNLWGLDTIETDRILQRKHPKSSVACIGPAGENKIRYACIQFERNTHSFSRAGMGAVMGAKKLKAIVVKGGENIHVHNQKLANKISTTIKNAATEFPLPRLFKKYGTAMFINKVSSLGLMYGENWKYKIPYDDITPLDIASYYNAVESKSFGCFRCPLKCGKHWRIQSGIYEGEKGSKYEVAYIMTLGLTLGIRDVPAILHLANKLNRMGMDINEFCGTVGMATDACKQGILTKDMTDGMVFDWGHVESYETIIERISYREGFGDILAEGAKRAAEKIGMGAEKYALHMKGMHWPAHSAPPFVLAFSISTRGGDFLKAFPHLLMDSVNQEICKKLFGAESETMDIYSHQAKGRAVWWHENYKLLLDSLGICFYLGLSLLPHGRLLPDDLGIAYNAVTGCELTGKDLIKAAERSNQVERAVNALKGGNRKHDSFSRRPEHDSWAQGIDLNKPGMLDEYYAHRGISQRGYPTRERLLEAGLPELICDLSRGKLVDRCLTNEKYLSLDHLIKNPSPKDVGHGLKAKIRNQVMKYVMSRLSKDPLIYREHYKKIGLKKGDVVK